MEELEFVAVFCRRDEPEDGLYAVPRRGRTGEVDIPVDKAPKGPVLLFVALLLACGMLKAKGQMVATATEEVIVWP